MAKNCNNCKAKTEAITENQGVTVPYVVHEATVARQERQSKRLWIALIVLTVALFLTNMAWIGYQSQFDTFSYDYTQDGNGNNIIGDNNEVDYDGAEIEDKNTQKEE